MAGGENEDDMSTMVYYLNSDENRWELKSEPMVSGITETTIHSSYAVINIDVDLDWTKLYIPKPSIPMSLASVVIISSVRKASFSTISLQGVNRCSQPQN